MPELIDRLTAQVDALLAELDAAQVASSAAIDHVDEDHRVGAVNLVNYTVLRSHDRRQMQTDLLEVGATSLATTEADVSAKVHAARNVLSALEHDPGPWPLDAIDAALDEGDHLLGAHADALFGPMRPGRPTRIMVTLPSEAADQPALVRAMVEAGMDVARVNCAHDGPLAWARMIAHVRSAAREAGRQVLVSMDLPGPKLRTGGITDGPAVGRARVTRDDSGATTAPARIWACPAGHVTTAPTSSPGSRPALGVEVDPAWLGRRRTGDKVHVSDARDIVRTFRVTQTSDGTQGTHGTHDTYNADGGVLLEGHHSTYLAAGGMLACGHDATAVGGIPAIPRRLLVSPGDELVLNGDDEPVDPPTVGQRARIGCALPEAIPALRPGDPVLFDDGAIVAVVESVSEREALLRVTQTKPGGQHLGSAKGINLPDTLLPVTALTDEDETRLPFILAHADIVAISFVRTASDIEHVLDRLHATGADDLGLVLKIETRQGFENLPAILLAAMHHPRVGIMIARGDMAVEVGFERLAEIPTQILTLCEAAHVPAIWATQVLDTLAQTGQPSRAEITDAAAAQRAECVMLNKGPHIIETIATLDRILVRMGATQHKSRTLMRHIHSWDKITHDKTD